MTEAELQAEIMRLARVLGLVCLHLRAPHREGDWRGFPDLWIIRPGGGRGAEMFRELKAPGKDLRAAQREWQHILDGRDCGVWKPHDWMTGLVQEQLHALAGVSCRPRPPASSRERLWRALRADAERGQAQR
jgi:hypothetical protein